MTTLGGRYLTIEVYPFSLNEFLDFSGIKHGQSDINITSAFQKIYLGDICGRNGISSPNPLRLMVKKVAESVKQPLSYNRIARILSSARGKISVPTVSNYLQYCEDTWLLLRLHNIASSFAEKETISKYYFSDNGLLNLFLIDGDTSLLENLVAVTLLRRYCNDSGNERVVECYEHNIRLSRFIFLMTIFYHNRIQQQMLLLLRIAS